MKRPQRHKDQERAIMVAFVLISVNAAKGKDLQPKLKRQRTRKAVGFIYCPLCVRYETPD
eukprot:982587-Amphidinium_carterae.2